MYDFETLNIIEEARRLKARRVAFQLPEGIKPYALSIVRELEEKAGCRVYILSDPCYGACDIALDECRILSVDLLVHFGHSPILSLEIPTIYVESTVNLQVKEAVRNVAYSLNYNKVGLAALIQHWKLLEDVKKILEEAGKKVLVGPPQGRLKRPGQVIGCDYSTAKEVSKDVEGFILLSGGIMHAVGLRLEVKKPVVVSDPFSGRVFDIEPYVKKMLSIRTLKISEASLAKTFGVVVGLKRGQYRPKLADNIASKLTEAGRKVFFIASREIRPDLEVNFSEIEAFVITACPLIPLFDYEAYRKPILTPSEAELVIKGVWNIEEYEPFKGF